MKQFNILAFGLCLLLTQFVQAQDTRYVDEVFDQIDIQTDIPYGQNISVLTMNNGDPDTIPLVMDVYTPVGDDLTERPTVIYLHTGSFLPQYFNGQITGSRTDSTVAYTCRRLARMGYTAIAATYRAGWLPTAEDQNIRTATLLQAAYRGIIDFRTCVRFLRKSVAEDGNPYGVDGTRIVAWGQGTGGYISTGAAFLDRYEEISSLPKFINTETALPFVTEAVDGDPYGIQPAFLNIPNWPEYESDFAMAVNMGGALGDSTWIEGDESPVDEPFSVGFHVVTDPFAPFGYGPVIVPTTQEFVVFVSGTRGINGRANALGVNDALQPVLDMPDALTQTAAFLSDVPVDLSALGQTPTTLATAHMYPFIAPDNRLESGPWDWWDKPTLDLVIAGVNQIFGTDFSSDTLHMNGLLTNPDMSAMKAQAYIDTIFNYYTPRACQGLQLSECALVNTEEILDNEIVNVNVAPNPSVDRVFITTSVEQPMDAIQVFDANGHFVRAHYDINNHQYDLRRQGLPAGVYILKLKFADGIAIRRVIFQ